MKRRRGGERKRRKRKEGEGKREGVKKERQRRI